MAQEQLISQCCKDKLACIQTEKKYLLLAYLQSVFKNFQFEVRLAHTHAGKNTWHQGRRRPEYSNEAGRFFFKVYLYNADYYNI